MRIDLSNAWKSGIRIINSVVSLLPNLILALVLFAVFLVLASGAKSIVRRISQQRQRRQSLGVLLGQLAQVAVVILGALIAVSVVAPSFQAGDLIKFLGVGSVAVGFAFQNILQNFLAGILILIHEPYRLGDFISIIGIEGVVEDIQTRATIIQTADGHRAVIPNAVLFTNPVVVRKAEYKSGVESPEKARVPARQDSRR